MLLGFITEFRVLQCGLGLYNGGKGSLYLYLSIESARSFSAFSLSILSLLVSRSKLEAADSAASSLSVKVLIWFWKQKG